MGSVKIYERKEIGQKLLSIFHSSMDRLEFLWQAFGISEERTANRANAVFGHLSSLLSELVKEENNLYECMREKISGYQEELKILCKELEVEIYEPDSKLPLLQKEEELRECLDKLEKEKYSRIKEYKLLAKKEATLCDLLAMPKTALSDIQKSIKPRIPTKQELHELQENIRMLTAEREARYQKFCSAKRELTTIMEVTEFCPETSFERDVVCYDDDDTFVLSNENLQQVTMLVQKFQQRRSELEQQKKVLTAKVMALWNRLDIDEHVRREFLHKFSECRQSTISALQDELNRCEEIKRQNISEYIVKLREEIRDLWGKCCIPEQDQKKFKAIKSKDFTEELLDMHDREVERLRQYYEETKEIFQKIEQRKFLWELMLKFERKATDPNRFNNRGGNLLQEERERKKLLKDLPKLEEEILKSIEEYEENNDDIFLVYGINFAEYIRDQWDQHIKDKENEKLERQRLRTLQVDSRPLSKTPSKRPLFSTPSSAPSKMSRTNAGLSVMRILPRSAKKIITKECTPCDSNKKKMNTVRRRSIRLNPISRTPLSRVLVERNETVTPKMVKSAHDTTSYSQFAIELEKNERDRCRSSVIMSGKKVLGSKISHSGTLRKSMSRSSRKSSNYSLRSSSKINTKSFRNTSRTPTKLTPARAKLGLPFLI